MSDNEIFFIVVYPSGDRTKLDVAEAQWFDVPDYDLASKKRFDEEKEAIEYAKELSIQYHIAYAGEVRVEKDGILDEY